MGQRVASPGVTIVDDGTLDGRRGSLNIDDEGTPTQCTTLIEDGVLTGYMQDTLNARLMGARPTGNGRRERSEEHTSELQSLLRTSYAVFCLKTKTNTQPTQHIS